MAIPAPGPEYSSEAAARCVVDVDLADFVALRFDTSVPAEGKSPALLAPEPQQLPDHYLSSVRQLRQELPVRIGICCGRWQQEQGVWELRPHEINLWPGCSLEMRKETVDQRLRIARDFFAANEVRDSGLPRRGSRWSGQLACCAQWVVAALHRARVPLIVHDGMLDILHLFDKFVGELPPDHLGFGRSWVEAFPTVFDTLVLAREVAGLVQKPGGSLSLAALHELHWRAPSKQTQVCYRERGLFTHRASAQLVGLVAGAGPGSVARSAMAVAELFLTEASLLASGLRQPAEAGPGQSASRSASGSPPGGRSAAQDGAPAHEERVATAQVPAGGVPAVGGLGRAGGGGARLVPGSCGSCGSRSAPITPPVASAAGHPTPSKERRPTRPACAAVAVDQAGPLTGGALLGSAFVAQGACRKRESGRLTAAEAPPKRRRGSGRSDRAQPAAEEANLLHLRGTGAAGKTAAEATSPKHTPGTSCAQGATLPPKRKRKRECGGPGGAGAKPRAEESDATTASSKQKRGGTSCPATVSEAATKCKQGVAGLAPAKVAAMEEAAPKQRVRTAQPATEQAGPDRHGSSDGRAEALPRTRCSEQAGEPEAFPAGLRKIPRCAVELASTSIERLTTMAARLASCSLRPAKDKQRKNFEVCRRFQGRVAAVETLQGYLRLDMLLQVQLFKRSKKDPEHAGKLLKVLVGRQPVAA